jgi:hypothetical protein
MRIPLSLSYPQANGDALLPGSHLSAWFLITRGEGRGMERRADK